MYFIVTELDKVLLLQALYAHADPKGHGNLDDLVKHTDNYNTSGLSLEDAKRIMETKDEQGRKGVDYINESPIKLNFHTDSFGQVLVSSYAYDIRNNKFSVDYINGRPIKLNFHTDSFGQVLVNSYAYDIRNGKYRFLEALLNTFLEDEILIKRKTYPKESNQEFEKERMRSLEGMAYFYEKMNNLVRVKDEKGTYFILKPKG